MKALYESAIAQRIVLKEYCRNGIVAFGIFFFYFDKKVQEDNDDKDKVCPQIWRSKLQWNKEELNFHKKGIFRILKVVCM